MEKLTPKQLAFCREYSVDHNGTQAAIRAGYSARTADRIASQNLRKIEVKKEIDRLEAQDAERTAGTRDRVIDRLMKIAFDGELGEVKVSDRIKALAMLNELLPKEEGEKGPVKFEVAITTKEPQGNGPITPTDTP